MVSLPSKTSTRGDEGKEVERKEGIEGTLDKHVDFLPVPVFPSHESSPYDEDEAGG
jgi:hypothetical protein